jgi:uncharacterized membrane protein YkvA (DUF1232 family)
MNSNIRTIWDKTASAIADNDRLTRLIEQANSKLVTIAKKDDSKNKLVNSVKMIIRMVRAQLSGEYDAFSTKSLFLLVFALVYFIIPTDMIPDFIPLMGFTDDITILYYVTDSLADDIAIYKEWESSKA